MMPIRWPILIVLVLASLVLLCVHMWWPVNSEVARWAACRENLLVIYNTVRADDDQPSRSVDGLLKKEEGGPIFVCPSGRREGRDRYYVFVSDDACWRRTDTPPLPLGWDNKPRHDGCRNVLFQGGMVSRMKEDDFKVALKRITDHGIPTYEPVGGRGKATWYGRWKNE